MRTGNVRTKDPRGVLFAVAVTILGIVLAGLIIFFVFRVKEDFYSYTIEADDLLRTLNRGDYVNAWYEAQENQGKGITAEKDPEYALPYAVTQYFEAASYHSAYEKSGEAEKTAEYRKQMDKAYSDMGELQYMAEEIDELFAE